MRYLIVIQWPASSIADYDRMIDIESFLIDHISGGSEIDGHDAGSGEVNIFIHTNDVDRAFHEIKDLLVKQAALDDARIAYRALEGDKYSILWPEDLESLSIS